MRLYNQVSCTPAVTRSNGLQESTAALKCAQSFFPVVDGNRRDQSLRNTPETQDTNVFSHDAFESPTRFNHHKASIPHVTNNITGTTASTCGSSPDGNLPAQHSFESFHFDIEVVKSAEKSKRQEAFEDWGDESTKASSSTLSSLLVNTKQPVFSMAEAHGQRISFPPLPVEDSKSFELLPPPSNVVRLRLSEKKATAILGAFSVPRMAKTGDNKLCPGTPAKPHQERLSDNNYGWTTPLFFERSSTGGFAKEDQADSHHKPEADEISWIDFGAFSSFKTIEPAQQPPQQAKVLVRPTAKETQPKQISKSLIGATVGNKHGGTGVEPKASSYRIKDLVAGDHTRVGQPKGSKRDTAHLTQLLQKRSGGPLKPSSTDSVDLESRQINFSSPPKTHRNTFLSQMLQNGAGVQPSSKANDEEAATKTKRNADFDQASLPTLASRPKTPCNTAFLSQMLQNRAGVQPASKANDEETAAKAKRNTDLDQTSRPTLASQAKTPRNTAFLSQMLQNRAGVQPSSTANDEEPAAEAPRKAKRNTDFLERTLQQRSNNQSTRSTDEKASGTRRSTDIQPATADVLSQMLASKNAAAESGPTPAVNPHPTDEQPEDVALSDADFVVSLNEKPEFAKYARMLKVGLPLPVVKNAMERDGVAVASKPETVKKKRPPSPQDPIQRFRIHWKTHNNTRSNTMWAMIGREDHWLADVSIDEEEMTALFQKERNQAPGMKRGNASAPEKCGKAAQVVDPKRANNCGIILARIKLSYREIATAIDNIDGSALTLEQINGIAQYLPTKEETAALQSHMNVSKSSQPFFVECEKFMAEIMRVKDAQKKVEAMLFMKRLPICIDELKSGECIS